MGGVGCDVDNRARKEVIGSKILRGGVAVVDVDVDVVMVDDGDFDDVVMVDVGDAVDVADEVTVARDESAVDGDEADNMVVDEDNDVNGTPALEVV